MKTWKQRVALCLMLCMVLSLMHPLTVLAAEDTLTVPQAQTGISTPADQPIGEAEISKPVLEDCDTLEESGLLDGELSLWLTGIASTTSVTLSVGDLESVHPYDNNTDKSWEISYPGAISISLTFDSQTFFENNYDKLYIYDENNNQKAMCTGNSLANQTITVTGSKVKLTLKTDSSVQKYGFKVTAATATVPALPSGTCGNDLTWELSSDGTLTISGTGPMYDNWSTLSDIPWHDDYNFDIKHVVIEEGVTTIGASAFFDCPELQSVTIPASVTSIGASAFFYCTALETVTFEGSAPTIADNAFTYVTATCRYPAGDSSWTDSVQQNYGGTLTWESAYLASGVCGDNLTWTLSNDGTLTISGTGPMYDWNYSSAPWRSNRDDIKTVVIEEGATSVGDYAFSSCYYLCSIDLADSITTIGDYAFEYCNRLTSIDLPDSVSSIGEYAFAYSGLQTITFGSDLTSIGLAAFFFCSNLKSVTLPDTLTSIGDYTFYSCSDLTSISIPDTITAIGKSVFQYCSGLTTVTIGSGVASIGEATFYKCSALTVITVDDDNEQFVSVDSILFSKDKTRLIAYPAGKTDTAYTVPANVTAIECLAFCDCKNLQTVTFEGSAPTIDDDAFPGVTATCRYPSNDSSWTSSVRQNYGGALTWQSYTPTSGTCGDNLTWELSGDGTLTISGTGPMYDWNDSSDVPWYGHKNNIKTIVIEEGATTVGNCAFYSCYSLTSIDLPDSITSIGEAAFDYCDSLQSITLPQNLTTIGAGAFQGCYSLTSIELPDSLTAIGSYAFQYCESLTAIEIPEGVTAIGDRTFSDCTKLASIDLPDSLTAIGEYAFAGCSVQSITIPAKVETIGDAAFYYCRSLTAFTVDANNEQYVSVGGVLFNRDKTILKVYPAGKTDTAYAIPDTVTTVEAYAFSGCTSLQSISLPNGLTTIGEYAFSSCASLTSVAFPQTLSTLGESAFQYCTGLKTISFGGSAPETGSNAFSNVTATCYYPASNPTWTESKRTNMGSKLTWVGVGAAGYEAAKLKNGYYEISNLSQLYWFAQYVNDGHPSANGRLMADITANTGDVMAAGTYSENTNYLQWTPIAAGTTYTGTFDGNGHTIRGLYYYCKDYSQSQTRGSFGGLFHNVSGTVKDLTLDNCFFYHYNYAASICRQNSGTVENCTVTAYISTKGNYDHGGIAYRNMESGTIADCTFHGRGTTASSAYNGICNTNNGTISGCVNYSNHVRAGIASSNYGTISNCHNYGFISGHNTSVGGICAWSNGTIIDCTNAGEINAIYMNTGGICGSNSGLIRRCINTAEISSSSTYTGGICGSNGGDQVCGGIIQSCSNTGSVYSSYSYTGGICGSNSGIVTGSCNSGSFYGNVANTGSICGCNEVRYMYDGSGKTKLYDMTGTVVNCISYYGSSIIGTATDGSFAKNNHTRSSLGNMSPAWLMNGMTTHGDLDWYQNIDNGKTPDSRAVLDDTHGTVYRTEGGIYTNTPQADDRSGSCGWNMEWSLDESGTLTITGSGTMDHFAPTAAPWYPYRNEIRTVRLEGNITSIGNYAFYDCSALTRVELGVNVTSIGSRAFALCTGLEEFYYGVSSLNAVIGTRAFYGCTALETFALPVYANVGNYAFENCPALNSIYINYYSAAYSPNITAGYESFTDVSATLYYPEGMNVPTVNGSTHGGTLNPVVVPCGPLSLDADWAYDAATGTLTISGSGVPQEYGAGDSTPWRGLQSSITRVVVEEGITGISNHLFEFMRQAETIDLPDSLTYLPYTAFNDCESLTHLRIPSGVTSMGNNYGFIRCDKLTDVYYVGTAGDWAQVEYSEYFRNDAAAAQLHCLILHEDAPTCTEPGTEAYYAFDDRSIYGEMYDLDMQIITQPETIPAKNHAGKYTVEGTAATCTESGLTDGIYCPDCASWLTVQTEIPAKNHAGKYTVEGTAATCTESGLTDGIYCPDCESWLTAQTEIPAKNHAGKYTVEGTAATCTESGLTDGIYCPDCASWLTAQTEIPAKNHAGKYTVEGTAASCTESGLTDGIYCPDCASWLTAQTEIPAKDHSKRYQIIDFELYYACDNCAERTVARSVVWNNQGIVVRMEAETQTMLLYSALYDSHGCMIEVRIDEVTRNEMALSFEQLEDAAKVRVFFLNRDRTPVLTFLEPLKTEFMQ